MPPGFGSGLGIVEASEMNHRGPIAGVLLLDRPLPVLELAIQCSRSDTVDAARPSSSVISRNEASSRSRLSISSRSATQSLHPAKIMSSAGRLLRASPAMLAGLLQPPVKPADAMAAIALRRAEATPRRYDYDDYPRHRKRPVRPAPP